MIVSYEFLFHASGYGLWIVCMGKARSWPSSIAVLSRLGTR